MTIVRLYRSRFSPKDATGAALHGGRWNSPGNAVLYASSTLALACLETLVHIRDVDLMPSDYVFCEIEVPTTLVGPWTWTGRAALARIESPVLSREYGDAWFQDTMPQSSRVATRDALLQSLPLEAQGMFRKMIGKIKIGKLVQTVPSVIVPREMNYLISTAHPQFGRLVWGQPQPFRFDPRLIAPAE
jgi:RES domain-containing protein